VASFVRNDFSVRGLQLQLALPLAYRIAGVWGGHEGSLLLWVLMLSRLDGSRWRVQPHLPAAMVARILGVMGLISVGFLLFMLFTSNPFERLLPAAADGRDLNPLLQDPGMVIHPPMLYMGYVGFSVAFAFAIAALLGGGSTRPGRAGRALDHGGLDVPHHRHRAGQRLGLLRAGLGRLVVLGSGRERLVHALAGRHGADPLAGGDREARRLQVLDRAAGDHRVLAVAARHLPGALGRADLGARLRHRSARGIFILVFLAS
jgi:ABC-type amino acid transport substrate-binding protein